ncbi:MAG: mechanosensitive ion channel family protein [Thermoplasmatota archaeon]
MSIWDFNIGGIELIEIIQILLIIFAGALIGKIVSMYLMRTFRKKLSQDHIKILTKTVYFAIVFIAALMILPIVGVKASSIMVAGGIVAIVLGFASQAIVGNLISGIFLVIERPMKVGDVVNIDGTIGMVEDIRIISTTIRTYDGYYVRVPNLTVFNSKIVNFFINKARRFEYIVGIRYRDDADRAVEVIRETIDEHPFALKYPEPIIFVETLGNSSVDITIKIWAPVTEWYEVRKDLLWKIKKNLETNGIFVPFPQREVWFNSELRMTRDDI